MKKIAKILKGYLIAAGVLATLGTIWLAAGWPVFFDRLTVKSQPPAPAEAIVCLTNGTIGNNIPTEAGWVRIYTAVQLYFDGWAPKVVFTGGGAGRISEAEVYADAARWLGCPAEAIVCEPGANRTADHPKRLLELPGLKIERGTPLIIATTLFHSRRTWLCFRKAGFTSVRVVTRYRARKTADPAKIRDLMTSTIPSYKPGQKAYRDVFKRIKDRSQDILEALRELAGIAWYKIKGDI